MSTAQHQLILPLQPFLSLASTLTGPVSTSNFILQIINHPHIFVFGEVLNIPQVKQLSDEDVNKKLLKLFAYGNYWDYKDSMEEYNLSEANILKLKKLSIVSLAQQSKNLEYEILMKKLDLDNVRDLEDILIDTTYTGLLKGKLDQKLKCFQVHEFCGRDVEPNTLGDIALKLENWSNHYESILLKLRDLSEDVIKKYKKHKLERNELQKIIKQIENNLQASIELEIPRQPNQ